MVNVTIAVPDDLKRRMDAQDTVNWSAVARNAFEHKLAFLEELDRVMAKKDEDFVGLGRIVNKGVAEKYRNASVIARIKQKKPTSRPASNAARR
jgi:hypothetical protein